MLRSLYSGVSGMKGFQIKLDVISNNIANVNTVGFKKGRVMFQDALSQNLSGVTNPEDGVRGGRNARQIGLGVTIGAIDTLHTPGSPMTTGVPLDLAIEGDGFFVVSPTGNIEDAFLTRAGNFYLDALGQLVTAQGYFVLSADQDIIVINREEVAAFDISSTGQIIVQTPDGEIEEDFAQIGIAIVQNPAGLRKVGNNLYQLTANADPNDLEELIVALGEDDDLGANVRIISGQLEMSNVDLTEEFTEMIVAQRGFQANSRIITTSDEILQEVVNLKR